MYSTRLNSKGGESVFLHLIIILTAKDDLSCLELFYNDTRTDVKQIKERNAAAVQIKKSALPELKRPALGEVGNIVKNIETRAAKQKSSNQPQKQSTAMFKDVKSKIDSHWKKNGVPTANTKRFTGAAPMLVTMKESQLAKPEVSKKVTIKEEGPSKRPTLVSQIPIKRQENIISRPVRSILRKTVSQNVSQASSRPESLYVVNNNIGMVVLPNVLPDVDDIDDDEDATNLFLASDYVKDIYAYLFQLERKFAIRENHLDGQDQVTKKMRTLLFDWINETHLELGLLIDTYYMTVAIIDRFLQAVTTTKRKDFQLVGVSAMFMASKYEEIYPPPITDFVYICDNTYTSEEIIAMEQVIFKHLEFNLSPPLVIHFTRRFSKAAIRKDNSYDHTMSKYFTELASIEYSSLQYLPSAIAAAAVFMSIKLTSTPNKPNDEIWTTTLQHYTTHSLDYLRPIIRTIAKIALHAPQAKENAVYRKYCIEKYEEVALRPVIYGPVMEGLLSF